MGASPKSRRERWNEVTKQTKDCGRCPPNKEENAKKQARPDKYKSKRR